MTSKREEITEYALRLIKHKSFSTFSYENISKEMKMTKAAVHYHFEKKDDLGLAICEKLQEGLIRSFELCHNDINNHMGHPWSFIESRINTISSDEICPIVSLQSDYENLSINLREKIEQLSMNEIELLKRLVKDYNQGFKADEVVISTLMSIKGALQYRRILGEEIFIDTVGAVKKQFYAYIAKEEKK